MPGIALWLMHQNVSHLMYEKYLQISVHPGNRENRVNLVNRSRHLKDDITVFSPVDIHSSYVARKDIGDLPLGS